MVGRVMSDPTRILRPGVTCRDLAMADQGAFLIEAKSYYRAVRKALLKAERSVTILAWDLHSKILLERDEDDGYPKELGEFLNAVLDEKPDLHIYILLWDFSMIYLAERESKLTSKWLRHPHERLHLKTDNKLPAGSSHHQKVVVVDQSLAFAGGIDLSAWRWDDPAHNYEDPRRKDPKGKPYGPYHDVQIAITGPAAKKLADLFAERWKRGTGSDRLDLGSPASTPPWPDEIITPDFEDKEIGFSFTYAAYESYPSVREIEELHLQIIQNTRHYLYLENQYLSSHRIVEAIIERLREPEGPEIIMVLTQDTNGWAEENTMGLIRDRLLEKINQADKYDRFRILYPRVTTKTGDSVQVYVHAKVIVMDDRLIKIGSSNLSNRSMRVDSEVDLVIEAPETDATAVKFLHRLLAVHFQLTPESVSELAEKQKDLRSVIDSLDQGNGHTLSPLRYGCENDAQRKLADSKLLDPEEPIDPGHWIRKAVPKPSRESTSRNIMQVSILIAVCLGLAALLSWGWGKVIDKETAISLLEGIRDSAWSPVILTGIFLAVGLLGISLNVLLVASTIVLNPWIAFATGLTGGLLSADIAFLIGKRWGQPLLHKFPSNQVDAINEKLTKHGILPVALLRLLPIAPFPVVNIAAGSSQLSLRNFNIGSVIGMAPGMLGVVLLADRTLAAVKEPSAFSIGLLIAVGVLMVGVIWFIRRTLRKHTEDG